MGFPSKLFTGYLTKCWGMTKIASSSGTEEISKRHFSQLTYLKKELLVNSSHRAVMLMEVSLSWDSFQNSSTLCYKAWLINSLDKTKRCTRSRKPFASTGSIERGAAVIDAVAQNFLGQLNLEQELFHFACLWVMRIGRGARLDEHSPAALPLLKSTIARVLFWMPAKEKLLLNIYFPTATFM